MDINQIMEFFYERIADRVSVRKKQLGITCKEIYPRDTKLISKIMSNTKTSKNPYLLYDSVVSTEIIDEKTGMYVKVGLKEKLGFSSEKELVWGTDEEIKAYLKEFFVLLLDEIELNFEAYKIDVDILLCDYIPYAFDYTYWNILFSKDNIYPAIFYNVREDKIIESIDNTREEALEFLYNKCEYDFYRMFKKFVKENYYIKDVHKKGMISFVENQFVPMLQQCIQDKNSLGMRVRELILADLSHCAELITHQTNDFSQYRSRLNRATSNYIMELTEIQKDSY